MTKEIKRYREDLETKGLPATDELYWIQELYWQLNGTEQLARELGQPLLGDPQND